jgi:hypothetical protein
MILRGGAVLLAALIGAGLPGVAIAAETGVCKVGDDRLTELSGLAATGTGYVVVNDGSDQASHRKIFYLDSKCKVVRTVSFPSRPRDTEDLGVAADGTLWVADIGDNDSTRSTIGLWRVPPGSKSPQLYRLSYPDGAHNAEALLLTRSGTPIIVTKSIGSAGVYVPAGALQAGKTTVLRQAGSVNLPVTGTANPFGLAGRLVITGGAVSPDGKHAVLRTYADAFEFPISDDDVARGITGDSPTPIALPNEPQGESVTYTPDGTALLTVSEEPDGKPAVIQRYALPDRPPVAISTPSSPSASSPGVSATAQARTPRGVARDDRLPAGLLVTGGVLVVAATILGGILLLRRRR